MPDHARSLTVDATGFVRDGRPHQIISAAVHYFRVLPQQWADRLERLRALGVNTIETYVAWNVHEPEPGSYDFSGGQDVAAFVRMAGNLGLDVIVRPGPYICAEWEFGGLPGWLLAAPGIRLRCRDEPYLAAVDRWFDALIPQLLPLQCSRGGPLVAVQVENEYGSYGNDRGYLEHLRAGLLRRGLDCLLFTADGPTDAMLQGGALPPLLATATFGSRPEDSLATLRRYQPHGPLMCTEFWHGWFDHWGEPHHTRDAAEAADVLHRMLAAGASVNIYMGHGGTNFGWYNGANHDGTAYQPTVTSYDYDAPIGEAGELTAKFHLFRDVIARHTGRTPPPPPPASRRLAPRTAAPDGVAPLADHLDVLSTPVRRVATEPMERLGQSLGLIHYRTGVSGPRPEATVHIDGLGDRAQLFLDGQEIGVLHRNAPQAGLPVQVPAGGATLDVLVENQGRINYGPPLADPKGISGGVRLDNQYLFDWEIRPLPLTDLSPLTFVAAPAAARGPAFHRVPVRLNEPSADCFVALPGWTKGVVWLNGRCLGRYWDMGPQRTLYAPAPLWATGRNELVVLELHTPGTHVELRGSSDLGDESG
ncbi:glycoside hydrolase family 35 protein [Streptomyces sp. CA-250714]|uniref:glycoside hydrolase family 35 protein n=1 Tax=Streptomyces sp. CA-250714 TaxID=3240060 RepID=UPI003D8D3C73